MTCNSTYSLEAQLQSVLMNLEVSRELVFLVSEILKKLGLEICCEHKLELSLESSRHGSCAESLKLWKADIELYIVAT